MKETKAALEAMRARLEQSARMSPAERRREMIAMGILTSDGQLRSSEGDDDSVPLPLAADWSHDE